jgi:CubicO group peptidase (beta-lactamase class C family)
MNPTNQNVPCRRSTPVRLPAFVFGLWMVVNPIFAGQTNADFSAITRQVQGWVDHGYYPGAAVLVAKDNQVVYEKCFGNYTPETQVFIASAGKWPAAATIMTLVDDGKLSLDDHPSRWLPEFKNDPKDKATLRQLLSHTSGYPPYQPKDKPVDKYQTLAESVEHILPLPPDSTPGERFDYGGLAMQVAGRMAEVASGQDWETLFQERIAKLCGMTNTHFTPVDSGGGHSPMLGGGARSTLHDYANFLAMIFNDGVFDGKRVLSKSAIQEMQADQVRGALVKPGEFTERVRGAKFNGIYGLGEWREQLDSAGNAVLISSPSWAGAYPWIDKTTGIYGVILAHVEGPNVGRDKFSGFFSSPVLAEMVRDAVTGSALAAAEHPRLLVKPSDREAILAKLEQSPWAKESYATLKARVDACLEHCQTNEQFMSSRLFMNWQTNYTTPVVRNSRTVGGEGNAPVPTPRFGGARDWATKYQPAAKLEDLKPYNDTDGKVWLFNKETGKEEWADPSQTGRMFETVNERIIQTAADAGFIYWVTGDEAYAKYASEILWTYLNGFSYMQPPRIAGGGGAQIIGFDSFEVIHEDIVTPLAESYDFIYDYLRKQGKDVGLIQQQLKRMADRVVDGGSASGNWNLNQARIIAYAGLPMEDNANYSDGKGRQYYVDVVLNARLSAQTGLTHVIKEGYDQASGVWPEAPGYSFGTTKDIVLIATLVGGDPAGRALLADPVLQRALTAQINLTYPNGFATGLGDTVNPRVNTVALELLIADARERSDTGLETRLTAALNREIATGNYNRASNASLVALTKYVGVLKEVPGAAANDQRTFFGEPLNVLMQRINGKDAVHSLAAAMFGTAGGHVHANGLAMELYGAGLILGADPGRGSSYWQADHTEYYSQPPAHNTVIVNGKSNYPIGRDQISMKLDALEPAPGEAGVSPDISFAQASFRYVAPAAEQQRTLALIRTSPRSGFYFDVFRSRALNPTNSFHDYLYHNIGQSLVLSNEAGKPLQLSATALLSSTNGCLKGYDYFKDEKSAEFSGNLSGVFSARLPDGSRHLMKVWMPESKGRRIFSVTAPGDHAGRDELPAYAETPMPTLIVRQQSDAWQKPFVAVYEPSLGSDGAAIGSVRAAKVDGKNLGLAACVVEGQTVAAGRKGKFSVLLAQDDRPDSEKHFEDSHLRGSFGVIIKRERTVAELYLGHGWSLGGPDVSLTAMSDSPVDVAMICEGDGWRYSSSSSLSASLVFSRPGNTAKVKSWKLLRTDTSGREEVDSVKIRESHAAGMKILVVEAVLSAGNDVRLSIEPAQR